MPALPLPFVVTDNYGSRCVCAMYVLYHVRFAFTYGYVQKREIFYRRWSTLPFDCGVLVLVDIFKSHFSSNFRHDIDFSVPFVPMLHNRTAYNTLDSIDCPHSTAIG